MTNKEIIAAISKIAAHKIKAKEIEVLRTNVLAEICRRGKNKINLGGPSKEDYVKRNVSDTPVFDPLDIFARLQRSDIGLSEKEAIILILKSCKITKKDVEENMGDYLSEINPSETKKRVQLSYRISTDDSNMLRGIDL